QYHSLSRSTSGPWAGRLDVRNTLSRLARSETERSGPINLRALRGRCHRRRCGIQPLLKCLSWKRSVHATVVFKNNCRRTPDQQLTTERQIRLDRSFTLRIWRWLVLQHLIPPRLNTIRCTPDIPRLGGRIRRQNGEQQGVYRVVVHAFKRLMQALAVATIRILKHRHLPRSITLD